MEKQCNPGHEEAPEGHCKDMNRRCCRTACHGHMSYCFAEGTPCLQGTVPVEGKCPVKGFRCCTPTENVKK